MDNRVLLGQNWGWILFAGLSYILVGIVSLSIPVASTFGLTIVLAGLLAATGLVQFVHAIEVRHHHGATMRFAQAILALAIALLIFVYPGLGMLGPYTIVSGSSVSLDYEMVLQVPPGAWGHIDLDLGGNGIYDATYFGPLASTFNQIVIPPNQYEIAGVYSQNIPGVYAIYAKAFGPGMQSQFETITGVNVIPEPASISFAAMAALIVCSRRRMRSICVVG